MPERACPHAHKPRSVTTAASKTGEKSPPAKEIEFGLWCQRRLQIEPILKALKKELRALTPGVNVDIEDIKEVLKNEVLKREVRLYTSYKLGRRSRTKAGKKRYGH